jgi:hypothetical protein
MRDLERAWQQHSCPIVNGILFPNGSVVPVVGWPSRIGSPTFGPRTTLRELDAIEPVEWTKLGPLAQAVSPDGAFLAVGGEGGMGADGFVALMAGSDKHLVWLAFFDDTNPFEAIRFEAGCVAASTSLGREFRFPVADPEGLVVT